MVPARPRMVRPVDWCLFRFSLMTQIVYTDIPRLHDAVGLHRHLKKLLIFPRRSCDALVRTAKVGRNPFQLKTRRAAAARIAAEAGGWTIPQDSAVLQFAPGELPGSTQAIAAAEHFFAQLQASGAIEETERTAKKKFLLSVAKGVDFVDHPDILSFMVSRPVVDMASRYFGAVPFLSSARIWWTPPNETVLKSQLYHRDGEDDRQLKFFFNVREVTENSGPFTFMPADVSQNVKKSLGYNAGRLDDEAVERAGGAGHVTSLTGPAGAGACLDTSRCLHYGSRGNTLGRLVLMFQYTSFYAPKAENVNWAQGVQKAGLRLDDVQKLALGIA